MKSSSNLAGWTPEAPSAMEEGDMKARRTPLVVMVTTLSLILWACGSNSAPNTAPPNSSTATSATTAATTTTTAATAESTTTTAASAGNVNVPEKCDGQAITVTYGQPSVQNAPVWIATDQKLFEKYGLVAGLSQVTGAAITTALMGGASDFIRSTTSSTFNANMQGGDTWLIGAILAKSTYDIVGLAGNVSSLADLRGKKIGIAGPGDGTDTAVRVALAEAGLTASDVQEVSGFNTDSERLAAVLNGLVDAAPVSGGLRQTYLAQGAITLTKLLESPSPYLQGGLFTRRAYAEANPDVVECFLKAMAEALYIFHTDKDTTLQITAKYERRPVADVEFEWNLFESAMNKTVSFTYDQVRASALAQVGRTPELATADPHRFGDTAYADALYQSGFYQQLWGDLWNGG